MMNLDDILVPASKAELTARGYKQRIGYMYCPYIPLTTTVISEISFDGLISTMTVFDGLISTMTVERRAVV